MFSDNFGVETSTMSTFNSNKTKVDIEAFFPTLIAKNVWFLSFCCLLQFFVHSFFCFFNILFHHRFLFFRLCLDAHSTIRTVWISSFFRILIETVDMNAVTTPFKLEPHLRRRFQIRETNRTILFRLFLNTFVWIQKCLTHANIADVAMEIILLFSHSAHLALIAVIHLLLRIIIEQLAGRAEVLAQVMETLLICANSSRRLLEIAFQATDDWNRVSVECLNGAAWPFDSLVLFVMAQSAGIPEFAARSLDFTAPLVMLTRLIDTFFHFCCEPPTLSKIYCFFN